MDKQIEQSQFEANHQFPKEREVKFPNGVYRREFLSLVASSAASTLLMTRRGRGLAGNGNSAKRPNIIFHYGRRVGSISQGQLKMVNEMQKPQKPPLSPARIVGESLAGAFGAIIGLAPLLSLLYQEAKHGPSEWGFGNLLALPLTYPFGGLISAAGVYLVGKIGNETGSLGLTLVSCAVGVAVVFAIGVQTIAREWRIDNGVLFVIFFATPTLGAIIGFNLTRKYKPTPL